MTACPTELELDRAVSVGLDGVLAAHVEICAGCRAFVDDTRDAIDLALELPVELPPATHLEERRTALLAAWDPVTIPRDALVPHAPPAPAPPRRRPLRWVALAAAGVAASVIGVIALRGSEPAPEVTVSHPLRGMVNPHAGAQYSRAAQPPDEIVRLRDGTIDLDVDPLAPGERFRVVVGADQVEVRGTSFEVVAAADHLVAVSVVHGRVEVTHAGAAPIVLTAGQAWRAPVVIAPPPATAMPPSLPPRRVPAVPQRTPRVTSDPIVAAVAPIASVDPQEVAFNRGWEAMRIGEYGQAAAAFNRAIALAPDGALSEDAAFWHAVAVARLHRQADAITAFRSFLDAFPTSTRAGEASAMLGWLLVDTRELDEARRRFHDAESDPNATARASARKGLELLGGTPPTR